MRKAEDNSGWSNPWRMAFSRTLPPAARRRAIRLVVTLELGYVVASVTAQLLVPAGWLDSIPGLTVLGVSLVGIMATLIYWLNHK